MRTDYATDVETSAAHSVWTSSKRVNKMLQKGYLATNGRVVLFFSAIQTYAVQLVPVAARGLVSLREDFWHGMKTADVKASLSRRFCSVAQMTSEVDWENTDEHRVEESWQG